VRFSALAARRSGVLVSPRCCSVSRTSVAEARLPRSLFSARPRYRTRRESTIVKELSPVPPDALAVETHDLRKEFVRKDRKRGKRRVAALETCRCGGGGGECVAILAQNGWGKSTLVRLLSTLLLPDGGSAQVFGYDVV